MNNLYSFYNYMNLATLPYAKLFDKFILTDFFLAIPRYLTASVYSSFINTSRIQKNRHHIGVPGVTSQIYDRYTVEEEDEIDLNDYYESLAYIIDDECG